MEKADIALFQKIFNWHGKRPVDKFMAVASHVGNGYIYPVIAVIVAVLDFAATKVILPIALTSFAIEGSVYGVAKFKLRRARPCHAIPGVENLTRYPDQFSFPSGHTAAAFVMATVLRFFYPQLSIPLYLSASTIGFSRIYNGLHFPSDVVAGGALGFISARLSLMIFV